MRLRLFISMGLLVLSNLVIAQAETHTYTFDNGVEMDIQYLFEGPDFQPKFNIALEGTYGYYGVIGDGALQIGLRGDYRLDASKKIMANFRTSAIPGLEDIAGGSELTNAEALFQYTFKQRLKKIKSTETVHSESAGYNTTAHYNVKLPRRVRTKFNVEAGLSHASGFSDIAIASESTTLNSANLGNFSSTNLELGFSLVRN